MDGNISSKMDITQPNLTSSPSYNQQPALKDKMHVVCFVVSCDEGTSPQNMGYLHRLKKIVISRGANFLRLKVHINHISTVKAYTHDCKPSVLLSKLCLNGLLAPDMDVRLTL